MTTIFISGVFNVVHPGHMRLFKFAKTLGRKLIVGINSDKLNNNLKFLNEKYRLENVKANRYVDEVILIKNSLEKTILKIQPDIVLKGREHEFRENIEQKILAKTGGKLIFSSGDQDLPNFDIIENSSLELLDRITLPKDYLNRHKISLKKIINRLNKFNKLRVCVLGDIIIDEYVTCKALGMSREDPTIVVSPFNNTKFLGGAGIVAAHCATLGSSVDLYGVLGFDENRNFTIKKSREYNINLIELVDKNRPTILKKRYRIENKNLLKVSTLKDEIISTNLQNKIYNKIEKKINKYDLIIFSDFNYGCLPENLINKLIRLAKRHKITLVADSQSSSQIGNILKFNNLDLITPTEHEIRVSLNNNHDGLVELTKKLIKKTNSKYIISKLGVEGIFIQSKMNIDNMITDQLKVLNHHPVDVSGAGDSLLAGSALSLVSKASIWESALIGSILSFIQISRLGNIPIRKNEIINLL